MKKTRNNKFNSLRLYKKGFVVFVCVLFIISFFNTLPLYATEKPQTGQKLQYTKSPEIQQVKPKKPVKIKLKRSAKGEYSWDLSGDNVDDVVKADKRLRKQLEME
jgi:cytochrome c oxidase assembly protein Cox11